MRSILAALCAINAVELASAHKILMAGEYENERRDWYEGVANRLATNDQTDNVVYFLTAGLALGEEIAISDRLVKMGIENNSEQAFS